jgi:regulator of protease activity HflC (stomatin/prohibitin superfamily)
MIITFLGISFAMLSLFAMILIAKATFLVRQAEVVIIERFGKFYRILEPGIHIVIPFIDTSRHVYWTFIKEDGKGKVIHRYSQYVERIDMREAVDDYPKQNVITKDNVTMEINALLYYQITDPRAAIYEIANLPQAIEKLAQTTMRDIIGSMDLDATLTSRSVINERLRDILDEATDKWGVKVNRVELQEVNPPIDIRVAMEKQMRAERDKRALILEAEGKKQAAILEAEGEKLARITRAEGDAQARLKLAEAEAEAISRIQHVVPGKDPLPYMIAQSYIKALPEITKDKEGKMMLVPYESSALMGSLGSIKELFAKEI